MMPGYRHVCAVAMLVIGMVTAIGAAATPVTGICSPTRIKYLASDQTFFQTTSTTFVNLPQGKLRFTQGGTGPSCVIVTLSAQPDAISEDGVQPAPMKVRVLLDDVAGLPNVVAFSDGHDFANQVRSFDFIFPSVEPGLHTVRVQFRAAPNAGFTDMNRHNLIVHYAP